MTAAGVKRALVRACHDLYQHRTLSVAAGLSYYFILAVFPGLILLSTILGAIPLPDLFGHILGAMRRVLPAETMKIVYSVLADVLRGNHRAWLSLGMLGTLWVASAAFHATIDALDMAYDVEDSRPFWRTRLLALLLTVICGVSLLFSSAFMILGPRFGEWLASTFGISWKWVSLWPSVQWVVAIGCSVLAVEALFFLGPNVKQRFLATLPGAALTVGCWIGLSSLLGIYFRHFADYNRTYGTLGGFIAFMNWFYFTLFFLLVGAEVNAELAKESRRGRLRQREQAVASRVDRAA
jgi:membrane protein